MSDILVNGTFKNNTESNTIAYADQISISKNESQADRNNKVAQDIENLRAQIGGGGGGGSLAPADYSTDWINITHAWEYGPDNAATRALGAYIMNAGVGSRFTHATELQNGNYAAIRNIYKVEPGDRLKFSFKPTTSYTYAYYILGANDIIIEAGETLANTSASFNEVELEVPNGGELFVFNYVVKSGYGIGQTVLIKRNKHNSIIKDAMYKDSDLAAMSERRALVSKDEYTDKLLTLAWISDTHGDERNYRRFIEYVNAHTGVIDGVIHTGDMSRMSNTDSALNDTIKRYKPVVPFIPVMGNHDSHGVMKRNTPNSKCPALTSGSSIWQATQYVNEFIDSSCVQGGTTGAEECYYYRDFTKYKIRIICLNEYDAPRIVSNANWETVTEDVWEATTSENKKEFTNYGKSTSYSVGDIVKYKGLYLRCKVDGTLKDNGDYDNSGLEVPWSSFNRDGRYLSQAQVDFFISALLSIPSDDWGVIIATHQVVEGFESGGGIANEKFHDGSSYFIKLGFANLQNGYIISDILGAYISKGILNKQYTSTVSGLDTVTINNVSFDERKGHIICCLNGHTHNCGCYWLNHCTNPSDSTIKYKVLNINQETGCYMPDVPAQAILQSSSYHKYNASDTIRSGILGQDCFNIISFDTVNHVVQILRIGADTTDKHIKRDYARISYEYKTSIPEKTGIALIPDNKGATRPSNPSVGEIFFDTILGKTIIYNGTKWVEEDGATAGVKRIGNNNQDIPSAADIYVGFKYYNATLMKYQTWNGSSWV